MTDRDKLIELIYCAGRDYDDYVDSQHEMGMSAHEDFDEWLADELLANGVILPPCKVGQTVWFIRNKTEVIATCIEKIILKHGGLYIKLCHNSMYETTCRSIGKTVFLTKEEAEEKLKELGK